MVLVEVGMNQKYWHSGSIERFNEMFDWCQHHIPDHFTWDGSRNLVFLNQEAHLMFMLKWA
jgi:hypothetical protein